MRQKQLEKHYFVGASILVVEIEHHTAKTQTGHGDGKNAKKRLRHSGVNPKGCLRK